MSRYGSIALVFMVVMMVITDAASAGSGCINGSTDGCLSLINMNIGEADINEDTDSSEFLMESHWGRMLSNYDQLTEPTKYPNKPAVADCSQGPKYRSCIRGGGSGGNKCGTYTRDC
ncbi:putative Transmembrane protein [Quillaja saponaria]|uniref:Transmembrane protein n=1 Tax=Quillaja saponaria TaxID=32244 RepID=A0AAD7PXP0_QUISA|nr:putative Transmembrane protein [Quillaja saponaria]